MAAPIIPERLPPPPELTEAAQHVVESIGESLEELAAGREPGEQYTEQEFEAFLAALAETRGIPLYESDAEMSKPPGKRRCSSEMTRIMTEIFQEAAIERGFMGGVPIPGDGSPPIVVEPRHPLRRTLQALGVRARDPGEDTRRAARSGYFALAASRLRKDRKYECVAEWWSDRLQKIVMIMEDAETKLRRHVLCPYRFNMQHEERWHLIADTLSAALNFDCTAEATALEFLKRHVTEHQFKQYIMTGMFVESSPRSGVTYIFRRLRPTIALGGTAARDGERNSKILACLCLHPIGYYSGSWAGVMVPTDDVLAHLLLMRGDEHMFWRQANQHSPRSINAGL